MSTTSEDSYDYELCLTEEDIFSAATGGVKFFYTLSMVLYVFAMILLAYCGLSFPISKLLESEWKIRALIIPALLKVIGCSPDLKKKLQADTGETAVLPDKVFSQFESHIVILNKVMLYLLMGIVEYFLFWIVIVFVIRYIVTIKIDNCGIYLALFFFVTALLVVIVFVVFHFYFHKNFTKWIKRFIKHKKSDEQIADICMELLDDKFKESFPVDQFYEKVGTLGQGSFGCVCEYHLSNDLIREQCKENEFSSYYLVDYVLRLLRAHCENMVAVKEITSNAVMAKREVAYLQQNPSHVNIIKLLGTCVAPDGLTPTNMVMELCQGSLKDLCKADMQRVLEEEEVALITWQILSGIEALHGNNYIHRDLTLGNILLKHRHGQANIDWETIPIDDITVKIGDFGLSRKMHDEVDSNDWATLTQVGTPGFWAPEVYNGHYHKSADIYSIGVITFHLCKKRQPTREERDDLHTGQYEPSNKMEDLLQQMMNYNPDARPTAAQARSFLSGAFDIFNPHVIQGPSTTVVEIAAIRTTTC